MESLRLNFTDMKKIQANDEREQHPLWPLLVMAENGIHEPHRPACAVPVPQDRICPVSELDLRLFPIWMPTKQLRMPR